MENLVGARGRCRPSASLQDLCLRSCCAYLCTWLAASPPDRPPFSSGRDTFRLMNFDSDDIARVAAELAEAAVAGPVHFKICQSCGATMGSKIRVCRQCRIKNGRPSMFRGVKQKNASLKWQARSAAAQTHGLASRGAQLSPGGEGSLNNPWADVRLPLSALAPFAGLRLAQQAERVRGHVPHP